MGTDTGQRLEYERRGPNDRAEIEYRARERARLTGIPHYVLSTMTESWVAGEGAKHEFWADVAPMRAYDRNGRPF